MIWPPPPPTTVWCINCKESFSDIWAYKRHQDECGEAGAERRRLSGDGCTLVGDEMDRAWPTTTE